MISKLRKNTVSSVVRRFARKEDGNIAVIFAIVLVPIISFVGAAIDYTRASNARTAMQAALDSAALMVSKDNSAGSLTAAQLTAKAQSYVSALYTNTDASNIAVTATYSNTSGSGSNILLTGSGTIGTQFMKVAGFPTMSFNTSSTTSWGMTMMRVALALDNTGSMADDNKMSALQSAAKNLIDQLSASATTNGDVYISVVPFANVVNLGTSFRNSGYIDWSYWSTKSNSSTADHDSNACSSANQSPSWFNGNVGCGSANNNINNWNGCVMDRGVSAPGTATGPDVTVAAPTTAATYYPADQSSYCPQQIAPLSYNWSNLKTVINNMSPAGGTNQPIGLVWAWQTLQQAAPFNAPAEDPNFVYRKAIILLSDGLNTMDRWYGNGSSPSSQVDARQQLLCDNIKAAGITIYTVQVNTSGDPESAILKSCASGTSNFFPTSTASGIANAFNQIGVSLARLRLSR
jgi:Flp pilus assembly protein TadG